MSFSCRGMNVKYSFCMMWLVNSCQMVFRSWVMNESMAVPTVFSALSDWDSPQSFPRTRRCGGMSW